MTSPRPERAPVHFEELEAEEARAPEERDVDEVLAHVDASPRSSRAEASAPRGAPALRTARITSLGPDGLLVTWRGLTSPVAAELDEGVDPALIARAFTQGDAVLVELDPGAAPAPLVVGVVQTRLPRAVELTGHTVVIDAEQELVLRAGRAAVRLREEGDVEVVGSRIVAMSRGLFRIVGRLLRLN